MVNEPLDLSKVLLKFHGGSYHSLVEFTKDMRFMFDNYKNFFRDPKIEVIIIFLCVIAIHKQLNIQQTTKFRRCYSQAARYSADTKCQRCSSLGVSSNDTLSSTTNFINYSKPVFNKFLLNLF